MNVHVKKFPGAKLPESKRAELDVTECATPSLFFHWTVLFTPITTLILPGLKKKLCMETETFPVADGNDVHVTEADVRANTGRLGMKTRERKMPATTMDRTATVTTSFS